MTNNAANPVIYIYSNRNIQTYVIRNYLPKCIAVKTQIYRDIERNLQEKSSFSVMRKRSVLVKVNTITAISIKTVKHKIVVEDIISEEEIDSELESLHGRTSQDRRCSL